VHFKPRTPSGLAANGIFRDVRHNTLLEYLQRTAHQSRRHSRGSCMCTSCVPQKRVRLFTRMLGQTRTYIPLLFSAGVARLSISDKYIVRHLEPGSMALAEHCIIDVLSMLARTHEMRSPTTTKSMSFSSRSYGTDGLVRCCARIGFGVMRQLLPALLPVARVARVARSALPSQPVGCASSDCLPSITTLDRLISDTPIAPIPSSVGKA
jgi:hypothetical protein